MADEEFKQAGDEGETPPVAVPSHEPLPLPPTVEYTRPRLAQSRQTGRGASSGGVGGPEQYSSDVASHGVGLAAGITLVVSMVAGAMAGNWADQRWNHTSVPWGTLIMTLIGAAAGILNVQRLLARANRNRNKK
jgi:hypothetical protein